MCDYKEKRNAIVKKRLLVTVGTYKFPELCEEILKNIGKLKDKYDITFQIGSSKLTPFINFLTRLYPDMQFIRREYNEKKFFDANIDKHPNLHQHNDVLHLQHNSFEHYIIAHNSIFSLELHRYIPGMSQENYDLILSHCGVGTILESLYKKKRLIAVVNNSLKNNHQEETARRFEEYVHCLKLENIVYCLINCTKDTFAVKTVKRHTTSLLSYIIEKI